MDPNRDRQPWRHPAVICGAAAFLGLLFIYLWPGFDRGFRAAFAQTVGDLPLRLAVVVALAHLLPVRKEPAERAFWILVTAAFASWFVADLVFQATPGGPPLLWGMLEDASFSLFYVLMILAVEQRPDRDPLPWSRSRPRRWVALTGGGLMVWLFLYLCVTTAVLRPEVYLGLVPSYLFYVTADAILIVLLVSRARVSPGPWRRTYGLLAAALLLWAAGDLIEALIWSGALELGYGTPADFLWYAPYLAVLAAAVARERDPVVLRDVAVEGPGAPVGWAFGYACVPPLVHVAVHVSGWLAGLELVRQGVTVGGTALLLGAAATAHTLARRARREVHVIVLDRELERSQRMEALGRMAGGVAHDFNNLLMILQGQVEILAPQLRGLPGGEQLLERTRSAVAQGSALTRQLLTFGRQSKVAVETLSPNEVVVELEDLLRRSVGEHIELVLDLDERAGWVDVDRSQLTQALMNLALNARSAMPDGGRLTIATRQVKLADRARSGEGRRDFVEIEVADTGTGMAPEAREHAFEPFFTTRRESGGSGLGLAVVHGTVTRAGGYVTCDSEAGRGTRFRIHLPRSAAKPRPAPAPAPALAPEPREPGTSQRTILLAEDEPVVRALTASFLRDGGFRVLEAASGEEALAVGRSHAGRIDLLLTDVVMPGIDGVELADRLTRERAQTAVLFVSGYARDLAERRQRSDLPLHFLQKPYTMAELQHQLRSLLEAGAPPAT